MKPTSSEQPTTPQTSLPRLEGMEGLRALAAMLIIIFHTVLLPNIQIPEYLDVIKKYFGHGVPLFYALSGFVLAYGYIDRLNSRKQIINFYIRRYFRIAPLFYFMIVMWLLVSRLKFNTLPSYHEIVLNMSLLFGLIPGTHESIVWAGWSIGVEILFYLLFPIIAVFVRTLRSGVMAVALAILVSSSFYATASTMNIGSYAYMNIITHLPTFLSGVLAFLLWRKTGFFQSVKLGAMLFAFTIISILAVIYIPAIHRMLTLASGVRLDVYIWGIIFMILILSVCFWPNPLIANHLTNKMGKISFSLYLWHPLIIVLLVGIYGKVGGFLGTGLLNITTCIGITITIVGIISLFSYRLIEMPGVELGKRLSVEK